MASPAQRGALRPPKHASLPHAAPAVPLLSSWSAAAAAAAAASAGASSAAAAAAAAAGLALASSPLQLRSPLAAGCSLAATAAFTFATPLGSPVSFLKIGPLETEPDFWFCDADPSAGGAGAGAVPGLGGGGGGGGGDAFPPLADLFGAGALGGAPLGSGSAASMLLPSEHDAFFAV